MDVVEKVRYDSAFTFIYSKREGTPAAKMPNQVLKKEKVKRRNRIMKLAKEISYEQGKALIGKTLNVIIEGYMPDEEVYVGRTYMDAPDVDGYLFATADRELISGDIIDVLVTDSNEYDLIGEINEPA